MRTPVQGDRHQASGIGPSGIGRRDHACANSLSGDDSFDVARLAVVEDDDWQSMFHAVVNGLCA